MNKKSFVDRTYTHDINRLKQKTYSILSDI